MMRILPMAALLLLVSAGQEEDYKRYMPLKSGNSWTYANGKSLKVVKSQKYEGAQVFVTRIKSGSDYREEWLTVDDTGVKLWRTKTKTGRYVKDLKYPKGLPIMAFPPIEGRKWDIKMRRGGIPVVRWAEMLKPEEIEVPAGTFKTWPVRVTEEVGGKIEVDDTIWYAMDVGPVQRKLTLKGRTTTYKLKSSRVKLPEAPKKSELTAEEATDKIRKELAKQARDAMKTEDFEAAQFFAELHRGLFGDEVDDIREKAAIQVHGGAKLVDSGASEYRKLGSVGADLSHAYSVFVKGENKLQLQAKQIMLKQMHQHLEGIKDFNRYRKEADLRACTWNFNSSHGCTLHARYLGKNGYRHFKSVREYHSEDPKNAFYTKEGHASAAKSDISSLPLSDSMKAWMDTFYHRVPMLNPGLKVIGTGMWEEGVDLTNPSLLDISSGRGKWNPKDREYSIYPVDGQKDVMVNFNKSGELPRPVPGVDERKIGYPITLSFYVHRRIAKVKAKLLLNGREVPCHISTPAAPSNPAAGFDMTVCLMTKEFMKKKSTYQVKISCEVDGEPFEKNWSFTTE